MTVAIVGGGIAGLYTALLYSDTYPEQKISIYEASGRWGGHIDTYYGSSIQYEKGAGRFNNHHRLLNALIQRFGLTPIPIVSKKLSCEYDSFPEPDTQQTRDASKTYESMTYGEYLEKRYSKQYRKVVQETFGYDAEFDKMNASDAIRMFQTDFRSNSQYFALKEGLSELVRRIVDTLRKRPNIHLYLRHTLMKWTATNGFNLTFVSQGQHNKERIVSVNANRLYLALPKNALIKLCSASPLRPFKSILNSVESVPLHRIYGRFTEASAYPDKRTTTRLDIRQYIPIHPEMKVSMVSYSDTHAANRWHALYVKDRIAFKSTLEQMLSKMFQSCSPQQQVNAPDYKLRWVRSYYWPAGVHVWKAGVSSDTIAHQLRQPLGLLIPCFIVGEAYSQHQGWIEGALQTVQQALRHS